MPEFILPIESALARKSFQGLNTFTQAYIEAMFFTSTATGDDMEDASFDELSAEALATIIDDCNDFQDSFEDLLEQAYDEPRYSAAQAGHDFWLTRNHHGAGFWDRGLPNAIGSKLTDMAHSYGEADLYRGDDGALYL